MNEDQTRNRLDNRPNDLAVLRHVALNILNTQKSKNLKPPKDHTSLVIHELEQPTIYELVIYHIRSFIIDLMIYYYNKYKM